MIHAADVMAFAPSRRTLTRTAAWAVPAVVLASAAPAFAVSGDVSLTSTWQLTTDEDIAWAQVGDLVWTVQGADLAAGSSVTLVVSDPNANLEGYIWLEARSGLQGAVIGSHAVPTGGTTTLSFTTTDVVPVGSSFSVTIGPENNETGSYAVAWTVDPANTGSEAVTGSVSWSASGGFAQA